MTPKPVKLRVMWSVGRRGALKRVTAWRVGDDPPQATRRLAINWHNDFAP